MESNRYQHRNLDRRHASSAGRRQRAVHSGKWSFWRISNSRRPAGKGRHALFFGTATKDEPACGTSFHRPAGEYPIRSVVLLSHYGKGLALYRKLMPEKGLLISPSPIPDIRSLYFHTPRRRRAGCRPDQQTTGILKASLPISDVQIGNGLQVC